MFIDSEKDKYGFQIKFLFLGFEKMRKYIFVDNFFPHYSSQVNYEIIKIITGLVYVLVFSKRLYLN